jgi:hypothetical protein
LVLRRSRGTTISKPGDLAVHDYSIIGIQGENLVGPGIAAVFRTALIKIMDES